MPDILNRFGRRFKKPKPKGKTNRVLIPTTDVVQPAPSTSVASSSGIDDPSDIAESVQPSSALIYEFLDISQEANPLLAEAKKRYSQAITSFDEAFIFYAAKNPKVIKLNTNGIAEATRHALSCQDTSQSGKIFGEIVQRVLQSVETDQMQSEIHAQVCSALSKLFPLIKLAFGLTQSVADVISLASRC